MPLPTNYEEFRSEEAAHMRQSQECRSIGCRCDRCRLSNDYNGYHLQPWAVGGSEVSCRLRFGRAPYGMPLDLRIEWSIEPEKDPNPL